MVFEKMPASAAHRRAAKMVFDGDLPSLDRRDLDLTVARTSRAQKPRVPGRIRIVPGGVRAAQAAGGDRVPEAGV